MKGIMFNLLEDFIRENWNEDKQRDIFALSSDTSKDPYVGPGTYPDSDFSALIETGAAALGMSSTELLRALGRFSIPKLAGRYPAFFSDYTDPRAFLKAIDSVIHPEMRKTFRNAQPPHIEYVETSPERLILRYSSQRRLCALLAGFLDGTADYFHAHLEHTQTRCMLNGAECCEFDLRIFDAS